MAQFNFSVDDHPVTPAEYPLAASLVSFLLRNIARMVQISEYASLSFGYSSKSRCALSFWCFPHFSPDLASTYLPLVSSSTSVSPVLSIVGRNFFFPMRLRPRFLPFGFFFPPFFTAYFVLLYARFRALASSLFFHAASSFFVAVTASRLKHRRISSRASHSRCTMWKQSMTMVALGKHSRTMAYM